MDIRDLRNDNNKHTPSIIWDWCAKPTSEEIDLKLKAFCENGINRVFLRVSDSLVIPYMSEEYFELVRTCARRCSKYNIELWIFDENSQISGNGGGEITSVADYCMREFTPLNGETKLVDDTEIDDNYVLRDKSRHYNRKYAPIADITDSFVTDCFIEQSYDKYIKQCKRFIGYEITGFVSQINMPSDSVLFSKSAYDKLYNDDKISLSTLSEALLSNDKKHYNIKDKYYSELSFLVSQNFMSKVHEKCSANNLKLSCGVGGASYISRQCLYMLSNMPHITVDSNDFDVVQIKLLTSVCEQFNKPSMAFVKSAAFSSCASRYNLSMQLAAMGINEICYDSVAFSLSGRLKREKNTTILSSFCEKDLSSRISRVLNIVNETVSDADTLVLYPSSYLNALHHSDIKKEKEFYSSFKKEISSLLEKGVQFHIADEYMLSAHSSVSPDRIRIGNKEYSTLIIPNSEYFNEKTISIIESFKDNCSALNSSSMFKDIPIFSDEGNSELSIFSDNDLIINYRRDETGLYALITSPSSDSKVSFEAVQGKNVFIADIECGEIYSCDFNEFTLAKGKTVVLISSSTLFADPAPPLFDNIQIKPFVSEEAIDFTLSSADENIFPLKIANVCLGKKSYINTNVDSLSKEFYSLSDGEIVKVKYPFTVQSKEIGKLFLYTENGNMFDSILLNGKPLPALKESYKDNNFYGCDITEYISSGKNVLSLEYKKFNNYSPFNIKRPHSYHYAYTPTSLEAVYLVGDFDVIDEKLCSSSSYTNDVTESGMPYYYGQLTYVLKLPDELSSKVLSVEGHFDICNIKIGKRSETFFSSKPIMELFNIDCGGVCEITVYNTAHNLFTSHNSPPTPFGISSVNICSI